MTKSEFVDKVASTSGLSQEGRRQAVDAVLSTIESALSAVRRSTSPASASSTSPSAAPARVATRAPGETMTIAASKVPRFTAGSGLKKAVKTGVRDAGAVTGALRRAPRQPRSPRRESQIVLGIDPDPGAPVAASAAERRRAAPIARRPAARSRRAVLAHCRALIDAAGPACVAVKPQLACFERLGSPGWLALEHVCAHARAAGLLVLADGKRGDVPVTAAAYAQALVGSTPTPFGAVARPRRRRASPPTRCSAATRSRR